MTNPTTGFEAEPTDVANHLDGITDPWERYVRATSAQAHFDAASRLAQTERDKALAALNDPALGKDKLSYEALADRTGLSRAGVQNAVERGRRAYEHA